MHREVYTKLVWSYIAMILSAVKLAFLHLLVVSRLPLARQQDQCQEGNYYHDGIYLSSGIYIEVQLVLSTIPVAYFWLINFTH